MSTFLEGLAADTWQRVRAAQRQVPWAALWSRSRQAPPVRSFKAALEQGPLPSVIAEFKRASPSKGAIAVDRDPVEVARRYVRGGAQAISVLTEPKRFCGQLSELLQVREISPVPVLRKDFVVDLYQIAEARVYGADAVLLIVALLGQRLPEFIREVQRFGMTPLVEVHEAAELELALQAGAEVIGVNNRNLATFETRLEVGEALLPKLPPGVLGVAESGLDAPEGVRRMVRAGARAILVGEALMRSARPEELIASWRGTIS